MKRGVTKTEFLRAIRRTNTALRAELRKKPEEQDADLIAEFSENLLYYRKELHALRAGARAASGFSRFARSSAFVLAALMLTFVIGAAVAQAAGLRIWTAMIKQDMGYLRVDYVPVSTEAPTQAPVWADSERSFFDARSFSAQLSADGFEPFVAELEGYEFFEGGIRSTSGDYYASYTLRSDHGIVRVRMICRSVPDDSVTIWGLPADAELIRQTLGESNVAYQVSDDAAFATWEKGGNLYCLSLYENTDCLEELLDQLAGRIG